MEPPQRRRLPRGRAFVPTFFNTNGRLERGRAPKETENRLYVPIHNGLVLVQPAPDGKLEPALLPRKGAEAFLSEPECMEAWVGGATQGALESLAAAARGSDDGQGVAASFWLLELSGLPEAPSPESLGLPEGAKWCPLRDRAGPSVCDNLAADDQAALLGVARGLALWHNSVKFCANCGGRTAPFRAGGNRKCDECGTRFRPRVDPSVIVLVVNGSKCLLGRKADWPQGRYSTLAGFVEFGETFEECVVREVEEESGVLVDPTSLRFVASQPWLFPRSLMVGYIAQADSTSVTVDEDELQDVRWFEAKEVRASLEGNPEAEGGFHVPSKVSLARTLIQTWLDEADWPQGRYSTLAGFVEFGETFEECVVREVEEESGVLVDPISLRFVASQPWLFPRSLMVGYIAQADSTSVTVDEDELQDVRWFEAKEVRASLEGNPEAEGGFHVPSKMSLARTLIQTWLDEADWPQGRYSTLAGFVEFGETFEECVVREVEEESGFLVGPTSLRFV
ncbi:unnamed protein product, partial [Polarella glacialis]